MPKRAKPLDLESECRAFWLKAYKRPPTDSELAWALKIARRADAHWRTVIADAIARGDMAKPGLVPC
jgi:hypothetical protein